MVVLVAIVSNNSVVTLSSQEDTLWLEEVVAVCLSL